MWDGFITGFCKVEFLCNAGEPTWLGGVVICLPLLLIFLLFWKK